jgi:predicted RNase H-like HicB family nuclease
MSEAREIELVFEPLEEGGYHVYAPDLPGLHTPGEDIGDASRNAEEALALWCLALFTRI